MNCFDSRTRSASTRRSKNGVLTHLNVADRIAQHGYALLIFTVPVPNSEEGIARSGRKSGKVLTGLSSGLVLLRLLVSIDGEVSSSSVRGCCKVAEERYVMAHAVQLLGKPGVDFTYG